MNVARASTEEQARARAGFSLIELMGVVVVLGLMAGMVAVSWQSMLPRAQLNQAVRDLSTQLSSVGQDQRSAEIRAAAPSATGLGGSTREET